MLSWSNRALRVLSSIMPAQCAGVDFIPQTHAEIWRDFSTNTRSGRGGNFSTHTLAKRGEKFSANRRAERGGNFSNTSGKRREVVRAENTDGYE